MPGRKIILAFCLICFVSSCTHAQQPPRPKPASNSSDTTKPVAPPPKPAADGPSLEVTMKFIQDKMNDMGPVKYTVITQFVQTRHESELGTSYGSVLNMTVELTNVVADPGRCIISYHNHSRSSTEGSKSWDADVVFDLKEVKKITVTPWEQVENDRSAGTITWTFRPPVFQVAADQGHKESRDFTVGDEELANRLARAITHAVEICTPDKKPEPF